MPTTILTRDSILNDHVHLRLFGAARVRLLAGDWRAEDLIDRFWRFYLNEDEGAWLEFDGERLPLQPKTGYFIPARVPFTGRNGAPVTHFYAHFDVLGLTEGLRRELFAAPVTVPPSPMLKSLAARTVGHFDSPAISGALDFPRQIQLKSLIYTALASYLSALPEATLQRARRQQQVYAPLEPALSYIEEQITRPLAIPELAALCHLSEDYFIRRFRQSMGQSPGAYIQERRVTLAAQRLLFSEESIEAIALQCGFGNRFYFSRVFKSHTGISPAAYRGTPRL